LNVSKAFLPNGLDSFETGYALLEFRINT